MINFCGVKPKTLRIMSDLLEASKGNQTLHDMAQRFVGVTSTEAYHELKHLSDYELKLIAVLIGQANEQMGKTH